MYRLNPTKVLPSVAIAHLEVFEGKVVRGNDFVIVSMNITSWICIQWECMYLGTPSGSQEQNDFFELR